MTSGDIIQRIRNIVLPILENTSIELLDVRLLTERGRRVLRLYIDKPGGVDLHDCTMVSREVSMLLDVNDLIPKRYTLEISSPGMDWPLQTPSDFRRNVGRLLKVTAQDPSGGTRTMVGNLVSCEEEGITLEVEGERISISRESIVTARLQPKF
jgi:ribosome maturation factor RimP